MGMSPKAIFGYGIIYRGEEDWESNLDYSEIFDYDNFSDDHEVDYDVIGYCEGNSYFLYVTESSKIAEWDESVEIKPAMLEVKPHWNALLNNKVKELGLSWREPQFLMTSRYS